MLMVFGNKPNSPVQETGHSDAKCCKRIRRSGAGGNAPFLNAENLLSRSRDAHCFSAQQQSLQARSYGIKKHDGVRSSEPVKSVVDKTKNAHDLTFFVNYKFSDYAARG